MTNRPINMAIYHPSLLLIIMAEVVKSFNFTTETKIEFTCRTYTNALSKGVITRAAPQSRMQYLLSRLFLFSIFGFYCTALAVEPYYRFSFRRVSNKTLTGKTSQICRTVNGVKTTDDAAINLVNDAFGSIALVVRRHSLAKYFPYVY